jgi:hypothetical protein
MPYPGLRSFRRDESDLFFGRDDSIGTMVDRLAATRFLAVLGSSGTGKSSVVKTGLLDALDLGLMTQAGSTWRVIDLRPGNTPYANLARGLIETSEGGSGRPIDEDEVNLLRAFLVRGPRSVVEWCGDGHLPAGTNLLLLVDQFEELFRYQDYAGGEEAEGFAALLIESARSRQFPIYVTLTMRSEYLGACALIEGLAEAISTGMFLTPRMGREECRAAIVGPASVCGVKLEDGLVNRLLNDLSAFAPWDDRSGRDRLDRLIRRADQLPLLQYSLNRMWVRAHDGGASASGITLTLADYERIGGLAGALNAHADEILDGLGRDKLPVAEATFRALTEGATIGDAVRRPTQLKELIAIGGGDETAVRAVVDAFRAPGCNFLAPEGGPANPQPLAAEAVVDISHESLIRQWKKMSEWLEKETRAARLWRRLRDRFDDGQPMQGAELSNVRAWVRDERPTAVWAQRYGGDYKAIVEFVDSSHRRERKFAPLMLPVIAFASLTFGFLMVFGTIQYIYAGTNQSWNWIPELAVYSQYLALTCAFGLWRYADNGPRRAVKAGIAIFLVTFVLGLAIDWLMIERGLAPWGATRWWVVALLFPCVVTVMAAFDRQFRNVFTWLGLSALAGAPLAFVFVPAMPFSNEARTLLSWAVGVLWFVGLGFQLSRAGDPLEVAGGSKARRAIVTMPLLMLSSLTMLLIWGAGILAIMSGGATKDTPWPANVAIIAIATAITCAGGLWRYRGLSAARAAMAGALTCALLLVSGLGLMGALTWSGMSQTVAGHWWGATLVAPCTLAAIVAFEPAPRMWSAWLRIGLLLVVPYTLVSLLIDYEIVQKSLFETILVIFFPLWFAAVGKQLQRPAQAKTLSVEG